MEVCIPMPTRSDATGDKHAFLVMAQKVRIGIVSLCNCGVEKAEFTGDLRIRAPSDSDTRN